MARLNACLATALLAAVPLASAVAQDVTAIRAGRLIDDRRFKAAISGAGQSNALAGYGTDQYVREYEAELGTPWGSTDTWIRVSYPFFHADRIATPTLFLCGDKDFNVPLLNSEQMYQSLRSLGRETQLVIYPGEYHEIRKPSYERDRLQRYLDWYGRHLQQQESQASTH
jgi:dipeptidyl aminopeptidase/acylaminoacyl peptidase